MIRLKHEPSPFTSGPLLIVDQGAKGALLVVDSRAQITDMQTFAFMRELKHSEALPPHETFKKQACPRCKDGYVDFCKKCDGEGERDCTCLECDDEHTTACKACDGTGGGIVCGLCDGKATVTAVRLEPDEPRIDVVTLPMKPVQAQSEVRA